MIAQLGSAEERGMRPRSDSSLLKETIGGEFRLIIGLL